MVRNSLFTRWGKRSASCHLPLIKQSASGVSARVRAIVHRDAWAVSPAWELFWSSSSVIIFKIDIVRISVGPAEGNAPLLSHCSDGWQYFERMRRLKMTRQEPKEEHQQSERDPVVKARLKQIRSEPSRKHMMAGVPKASVIIATPTHYAVALSGESGRMGTPVCVAIGFVMRLKGKIVSARTERRK